MVQPNKAFKEALQEANIPPKYWEQTLKGAGFQELHDFVEVGSWKADKKYVGCGIYPIKDDKGARAQSHLAFFLAAKAHVKVGPRVRLVTLSKIADDVAKRNPFFEAKSDANGVDFLFIDRFFQHGGQPPYSGEVSARVEQYLSTLMSFNVGIGYRSSARKQSRMDWYTLDFQEELEANSILHNVGG